MTPVLAAIVSTPGAVPRISEIKFAELPLHAVRVRLVAAGVCHTDLVRGADLESDFPVVLGHEGAGVVEEVGAGVDLHRIGDRVLFSIAHHCGRCAQCDSGRPMLCEDRLSAGIEPLVGGQAVVPGFGIGAFATCAVVHERSLVAVPSGIPLEVAAITACCVVTGLGAALNAAGAIAGNRVVVLGAGAVGLCVIMGCRMAGAGSLVAVDPDPERRDRARQNGAGEAVADMAALPAGAADVVIECVGSAAVMSRASSLARRGGEVILLGVTGPGEALTIDARDLVIGAKTLRGSLTGNLRPHADFARIFRLYEAGLLPLDGLIDSRIPFDALAEALESWPSHRGVKTLVTFQ